MTAIEGDKTVTGVEVTHKQTGERTHVPADTVVAALGFIASIGPLADWGLDLDKRRLVVDTTMATNNPRVYAAGDIATYAGRSRSSPSDSAKPLWRSTMQLPTSTRPTAFSQVTRRENQAPDTLGSTMTTGIRRRARG